MTIQAGAYALVHPSFVEPDLLLQYSQPSGFIDLLAGGEPRVKIAEDDLLVYIKTLNLRSKVAAGTTGFNELPGVDITAQMISTATYLVQASAQYNHHDTAAGGRWGFSTVDAYRLGLMQGFYQMARDAALYGFNPQNGEGFLNAPGATSVNLPPDSFGNDTVVTYDNGQMAFFLSQQIANIKTNTLQHGIGREFTILGPQRTLASFQYNVVQLVQFQREGAGTASTMGTLEKIIMPNGDTLNWVYDDTLIGKGSGGADMVIIGMPEVEVPMRPTWNTNAFASLAPSNATCLTQYADMAAPREIVSPGPYGQTNLLMEQRLTSGWAPRAQALVLVSMQYS